MNGTKLEGKIGRIDNTDFKATCWDIVKKKKVDLVYLRDCIKYRREEARECYNNQMRVGYKLTEEEFNTLKEGLGE